MDNIDIEQDELDDLYYYPKTKGDVVVDTILEWIETVVLAIFAMILIMGFVIKFVSVCGISMESTLYDSDKLLVSSFLYTAKQGDIVVINSEFLDETIIKRVIAVGGQTVEIDYNNGTVSVDGVVIDEPYINEPMHDFGSFSSNAYDAEKGCYVYEVPVGCVFVMGDNRNHSTDSRVIGFVNNSEIIGKAVFRFYSDKGSAGFLKD